MALAAFASAVAMTAIAVAVPALSRHWSLGQHEVHWVASGFMAAMLPAMLATPRLLQWLGVRRTALAALLLLAAGGAAGALAQSFGALLAARTVEGFAAGVLQPLPLIVVARNFANEERGRAMGLFTLGIVLAPAVAPALAGALVDHLGWRAVLPAAAPFALLAACVGWRVLPVDRGPTPAAPGLRLDLFADTEFRRSCGVAFLYGMAAFAASYLVPVFLQMGLQRSAAAAGAVLMPAGIALAVSSPWGGRLADRYPRHRVIAVGIVGLGVAHLAIIALSPSASLVWLVLLLVASRLGAALALPSLALDALRGLPGADWPAASALVSLARQLGATLGVALSSMFVQWRLVAEGAALPAFHQSFVLIAALCALGAWVAWRNGPVTRAGCCARE